jgi:hypothetical protein
MPSRQPVRIKERADREDSILHSAFCEKSKSCIVIIWIILHATLCCLLHAGFLLGFFSPEDGGDIYLRNVCSLSTEYTALYPIRRNPLEEPLNSTDESKLNSSLKPFCTHQTENIVSNNVPIVLVVFTDSLLRNALHNPIVVLLRVCMLRTLPSNGRWLPSHCLARGLYATIFHAFYESKAFITMFTKALHGTQYSANWIQSKFHVQFL